MLMFCLITFVSGHFTEKYGSDHEIFHRRNELFCIYHFTENNK
jgi:hypothetical protein